MILKSGFWFSGGLYFLGAELAPGNCQALGEGRDSISSSEGSLQPTAGYGCRTCQWVATCQGVLIALSLQGLWSGAGQWEGRWMLGEREERKRRDQGRGGLPVLILLCDWRTNLQTGPHGSSKGVDIPGDLRHLELLIQASHDPAALGLLAFPTVPGQQAQLTQAVTDEGKCPQSKVDSKLWWQTRLPRKPGIHPSSRLGRTRSISPAFPNWHLPLPCCSEQEALLTCLSSSG